MSIIGLAGLIGSGKNTVGEILVAEHGFKAVSFASALKDACSVIFHWPRELLEGDTAESRAWRDQVDQWWSDNLGIPNFTPRFALQNIGTDVLRKYFHPDIWVLSVSRVLETAQQSNIVVTDCRFFNELDIIKRYGGSNWQVCRHEFPDWTDTAVQANTSTSATVRQSAKRTLGSLGVHPSESSALGYSFDKMINNIGTLDDLRFSVQSAVTGLI